MGGLSATVLEADHPRLRVLLLFPFLFLTNSTFKEQFMKAKYERKEYHKDAKPVNTVNSECGLPCRTGYLTKQGAVVKNWKKR